MTVVRMNEFDSFDIDVPDKNDAKALHNDVVRMQIDTVKYGFMMMKQQLDSKHANSNALCHHAFRMTSL